MRSRTVPWAELKVDGSRWAFSTSSNRLSAQKSYSSFRYSGASSRSRFHTGYGSRSTSSSKGSQCKGFTVTVADRSSQDLGETGVGPVKPALTPTPRLTEEFEVGCNSRRRAQLKSMKTHTR